MSEPTPFPSLRAQRRPLPKLPAREPDDIEKLLCKSQDAHLRHVTDIVAGVFKSLLLTMPHDQAEETLQRSVDLGFAKGMQP